MPIAPGSSQTFPCAVTSPSTGTTHPTTWQVTARGEGNGIVGPHNRVHLQGLRS
jgi:hypothetical protein